MMEIERKAGWLSRCTLGWLNPLLDIGYTRPLTSSDLPQLKLQSIHPLPSPLSSDDTLQSRLYRFAVTRGLYTNALLMLAADVVTYVIPVLQSALLQLIETRADGAKLMPEDYAKGGAICIAMFLLQCLSTLAINTYYKKTMTMGMEIRAAVQIEVYEKALRMGHDVNSVSSSGFIVNLVANDAARLDLAVPFLHYWWSNPFQCLLVAAILYAYVGWSALVGVSILIAFVPLQSIGAVFMSRTRKKAAKKTDERLRVFQEVLTGIKTVKLKAWEDVFLRELEEIRKEELGILSHAQLIRAFISMMSVTLPLLAFLLTMVMYHVVGKHPISQSITMTVIAYFSLVRQPLSLMPLVVSTTSDARSAISRLSAFLDRVEIPPGIVAANKKDDSHDAIVKMENVVFQYYEKSFKISCEHLEIERGELVVITGPIGSGKTSLLMAILGEMSLISGSVYIKDTPKPYSSQSPWIQNKSVKENVLFQKPFDEKLYAQVISWCQLSEDLGKLPEGDETVIGDRGATLSGGQKIRISLGRCLYSALYGDDLVLLDDPLASVDQKVSKLLIEECLDSKNTRHLTRIIVSSHPLLLKKADKVIVVEGGRVVGVGKLDGLGVPVQEQDPIAVQEYTYPQSKPLVQEPEEGLEHGSISTAVFREYLKLAGDWFLYTLPCIFFSIVQQVTRTMSDITASQWAHVKDPSKSNWYIYVFCAYTFGHGLAFFVNAVIFLAGGRRAGRQLNWRAHCGVFTAPLTWILNQSTGRLTNRLSADQEIVDYVLPESLRAALVVAANVSATLVLLVIHKWYNSVPIAIIVVLLFYFLQYYRASSRELGRLSAVAKGPLQSHYVETVHGLVTIRAFHQQVNSRMRAQDLILNANQPYYTSFVLQRWLELRVTMLGNVLVLLAALSTLFVTGPLALTSATMNKTLTVTRVLNWLVRRMADSELQFISVERLLYLNNLPSEPLDISKDTRQEKIAPRSLGGSSLEFRNVSCRYALFNSLAIENISFSVLPGEKIGIVGRTGSGKSTLLLTLFRAVTPEPGSLVLLDGQDAAVIPLRTLRKRISIIPQEPFLFTGSLRKNIDPEGIHGDDEIWRVLELTGLNGHIEDLEHSITPDSGELSAGQKQLLAMARVLLESPSLLVMDEATASLDTQTESVLIKLLSTQLSACTVLAIAHRIPSVSNCDRVLVLDEGKIVEEGRPEELLLKKESAFSQLSVHSMD